jgi:Cytochrome c1
VKNLYKLFSIIIIISASNSYSFAAEKVEYLKTDWSFKGLFGKFDRASLQRGYQVYTEVCASCHSMKYLSYRNLAEPGGPEFSEAQAKAIAASFEVTDGPNSDGEMFTRPGKLSEKL